LEFSSTHGDSIRGGAALHPTATATTVRVKGARGGDVVLSDGPYAETKEALTGFFLIEAADPDEALRIAADIPATCMSPRTRFRKLRSERCASGRSPASPPRRAPG